jgi:hypothetical protein
LLNGGAALSLDGVHVHACLLRSRPAMARRDREDHGIVYWAHTSREQRASGWSHPSIGGLRHPERGCREPQNSVAQGTPRPNAGEFVAPGISRSGRYVRTWGRPTPLWARRVLHCVRVAPAAQPIESAGASGRGPLGTPGLLAPLPLAPASGDSSYGSQAFELCASVGICFHGRRWPVS